MLLGEEQAPWAGNILDKMPKKTRLPERIAMCHQYLLVCLGSIDQENLLVQRPKVSNEGFVRPSCRPLEEHRAGRARIDDMLELPDEGEVVSRTGNVAQGREGTRVEDDAVKLEDAVLDGEVEEELGKEGLSGELRFVELSLREGADERLREGEY